MRIFFFIMWKRTIQYAPVVQSRRPVFVGLGHGQIVDRKRRYTYIHAYYNNIYIILLSQFAGGVRVPFQQCVLFAKPFSRAPVLARKPEQMCHPDTCRCLEDTKTPRHRVANNILYSTVKIDIEAKQNKRVFKHIHVYSDRVNLFSGRCTRIIFHRSLYCECVCQATTTTTTTTKCRYGILFFDPRGCLQRKGVCDIRIIYYMCVCVYMRTSSPHLPSRTRQMSFIETGTRAS